MLKKIARHYTLRHKLNVVSSFFARDVIAMKKFAGVGRGRRCFIMGNGPSLKKINPKVLGSEVTFGTNGIYLVKDWLGFLPTYHVTEDKLVIEDRGQEISKLVGPIKFYDRRWLPHIPINGEVVTPRVIYDYSEYTDFPLFSEDASRCLWVGGTVTYLCLQLAFYMGFSEVYLVGFDHKYERPSHVVADGAVWTSQGDDPNHIHPDYFGKGKRWHDPRVDRMEMAYRKAKIHYDRAGRLVANATVGGALEVFRRVDFDSLFPNGIQRTK